MKMLLVKNDFEDNQIILDVFKSLLKTVKVNEVNGYIAFYFSYEDDEDIIHTLNALEIELLKSVHAYLSYDRLESKLDKELDIAIDLMNKLPSGIYTLKDALLRANNIENKSTILSFILEGSGINQDFIRDFAINDLNVSRAAKTMSFHRNTINYKLNKLKNNNYFDLTNFKDAYILYSLLENKLG